ncbi:MAG: RdgB/HAM1 family non-canonical purine NTP pyrophosphatase [Acidobacteriaceae bacterium]|nr:RdgB/HAM1 family non-canonical purine NTP pyrophosphatase [Acidobacteriaceae bacterium]
MILYACSKNPGKLREFALATREFAPQVTIDCLPGLEGIPAPEENGSTFEENASLKALYYSRFTPELVFADDSGLEVDALGGAPGIYSARYAGPDAIDTANNELLLEHLQDEKNRKARFLCVIALAKADRILETFRGAVEGHLLTARVGSNGFGYDPLFYYPPLGRTFAELSPEKKFSVSHRGKALRKLFEALSRDVT